MEYKQERLGSHYERYKQNPEMIQEINSNEYKNNDYKNAFSEIYNKQSSISQEPDIIYEKVDHYLAVSSLDRDTSNYPKTNSYTVILPKEYKNIVKMQLIESIIPNQNSVTSQPYLLLNIKELKGKMPISSANSAIANSFAIIQMTNSTGSFIQLDRKIHENLVFNALQPINLSRMTISLTDYTGTPFEFGGSAGTIDPLYQNTLVFKIVTLEKSRKELKQRAILG